MNELRVTLITFSPEPEHSVHGSPLTVPLLWHDVQGIPIFTQPVCGTRCEISGITKFSISKTLADFSNIEMCHVDTPRYNCFHSMEHITHPVVTSSPFWVGS